MDRDSNKMCAIEREKHSHARTSHTHTNTQYDYLRWWWWSSFCWRKKARRRRREKHKKAVWIDSPLVRTKTHVQISGVCIFRCCRCIHALAEHIHCRLYMIHTHSIHTLYFRLRLLFSSFFLSIFLSHSCVLCLCTLHAHSHIRCRVVFSFRLVSFYCLFVAFYNKRVCPCLSVFILLLFSCAGLCCELLCWCVICWFDTVVVVAVVLRAWILWYCTVHWDLWPHSVHRNAAFRFWCQTHTHTHIRMHIHSLTQRLPMCPDKKRPNNNNNNGSIHKINMLKCLQQQ